MKNTTQKIKTIEELTKSGYYYVNKSINNENFPAPKEAQAENWKMIPLERYQTSEECLEIVRNAGGRPATIHELALLKESHPDAFINGKWHVAFGSVWTDSDGDRRVPLVDARTDGDFRFGLGDWDGVWYSVHVLVCFCDTQPSETSALKPALEPLVSSALDDMAEHEAIELLKSRGFTVTRTY